MSILLLIFDPPVKSKDNIDPHPNSMSYVWIGMPIEVNCQWFIVWFQIIYTSPHPWKFGEVEGHRLQSCFLFTSKMPC